MFKQNIVKMSIMICSLVVLGSIGEEGLNLYLLWAGFGRRISFSSGVISDMKSL